MVILRLAVEYQNNEFVLFEMDGNKLELSRALEYKTIGDEIALNTFSVSPNYSGRAKTNSVSNKFFLIFLLKLTAILNIFIKKTVGMIPTVFFYN